mmetsp:Transcript_19234/g.41338  ORF Transcript_19234/g.41338 Transcript_19234/m.41338 type:complete len:100 (-) Transcript_19234:61-360(-)
MSYTATNDESYASLGDAAHYATLASAFLFAFSVVHFAGNGSMGDDGDDKNTIGDPLFDTQWKADGFCVTNGNKPYWSSHDVCFYVDTIATVALGILHYL